MKIAPAATAVTVGMTTSRNSRDRTFQFFRARREAGRRVSPASSDWLPPGGRDAPGAEPPGAAAGPPSRDPPLIAELGILRIFLDRDRTALARLTMRSTGVQRHQCAAAVR